MTNKNITRRNKEVIYIKWEPPDFGFFKLNIDGACKSNTSKGGIGGIFRDNNMKWIMGFNMGIHYTTNIYMEILALLYGLKIAIQKDFLPLLIETDCKGLISMLSNHSCSYQNLIDDCRFLLSEAKLEELEEVEERLASLVQKCPNLRILHQIHAHIITHSFLPPPTISFILSKVVTFAALSPNGSLIYAKRLLTQIPNPSIFSYNSLIRGFLESQIPSHEPLFIFKKLLRRNYPKANTFTLAFVLKSCSILTAFSEGQQVHKHAVQSGFGSCPFVQTSLLNLYAKCEEIGLSEKVFDEIPDRNVVAWSAMISGYSRLGMVNESFSLFREMQKTGVLPDKVTMVSVISACAMSGALDLGRWVHAYIHKRSIENDLELSTALVNMYAKCGYIEKAIEVFEAMPFKDAKAWSSMIVGLAVNGLAEYALVTFSRMNKAKVEPNHVTLVGVLMACAHSGLVSEGKRYWASMIESGIEPSLEHYGCMVDLLCRSNIIDEAYSFVEAMPLAPCPAILRTLLVGCKKNYILDKGEILGQHLIELEPWNAENYILLSSLYASVSDWEKMRHVRKLMKDKGIKAMPGCSSVEVDGFVHGFVMGDWSHPEAEEIKEVLRDISERVYSAGHEPWIATILHNVSDEAKEIALCEHSERLAIAFGLLKTKAPTVIRIVKNLRVCRDCHEVTKIISRLYNREIIVRDRVRFHRFVNGACSCRDFW